VRFALVLFLLAAAARGQGGRDGRTGVLFVAIDISVESDAIHRAAWRALEPHNVERRRIVTYFGDEKKARAYLRANKGAPVVVAYDRLAAGFAAEELPNAAILRVYEEKGAHVHTLTDWRRFVDAVGLLLGTRYGHRSTTELVPLEKTDAFGNLAGQSVDWIKEGVPYERGDKPIVSTSGRVPEGAAILTMRPDPRSLGLHVAAQVLSYLRHKKPFHRVTVRRMRLTIDLGAAKRAHITVPLKLLARADVVRRDR